VPEKQRMRETTYRAKRKELKNAIKASMARCFQELCEAADAEPFGSPYRMFMGKLNRQPTPTGHLLLEQIVSTPFPSQPSEPERYKYNFVRDQPSLYEIV